MKRILKEDSNFSKFKHYMIFFASILRTRTLYLLLVLLNLCTWNQECLWDLIGYLQTKCLHDCLWLVGISYSSFICSRLFWVFSFTESTVISSLTGDCGGEAVPLTLPINLQALPSLTHGGHLSVQLENRHRARVSNNHIVTKNTKFCLPLLNCL